MELSRRLCAVADMVSEGSRLVDVGTDHGLVPIFLVKEKRIPSALAVDVKPGPLSRAEEHIAAYRLTEYIKTRLSDGLRNICSGEGDTLLLAGMGGPLMVRILTEGREVLSSFQELVLQPQSMIALVRRTLADFGWKVQKEAMVFEEGKYYPLMQLVQGKDCYEHEIEYRYGRLLLAERNPVLEQFLCRQQTLFSQLREQLLEKQEKGGAVLQRILEVEEELNRLREALHLYEVSRTDCEF